MVLRLEQHRVQSEDQKLVHSVAVGDERALRELRHLWWLHGGYMVVTWWLRGYMMVTWLRGGDVVVTW